MNKKILSLKKDGNMWCVLWGENLQEGIAGFGDIMETAMQNFVNEYNTKKKRGTMNLEEKFLAHIHQLQNKQFTAKIPELIHDFALIAQEGQEVIAESELHMMGEVYVNSKDKKEENVEAWVNRMIAKKPVRLRGKGMIIKLEVQE